MLFNYISFASFLAAVSWLAVSLLAAVMSLGLWLSSENLQVQWLPSVFEGDPARRGKTAVRGHVSRLCRPGH